MTRILPLGFRLLAAALLLAECATALAASDRGSWLPRGVAELQALDKITARSATLTIKVGNSARFESLTVLVRSCMIRPSDMARDAAAYLTITDEHQGASPFNGWMLQSAPFVSMLEHPIYDIRVLGCRA